MATHSATFVPHNQVWREVHPFACGNHKISTTTIVLLNSGMPQKSSSGCCLPANSGLRVSQIYTVMQSLGETAEVWRCRSIIIYYTKTYLIVRWHDNASMHCAQVATCIGHCLIVFPSFGLIPAMREITQKKAFFKETYYKSGTTSRKGFKLLRSRCPNFTAFCIQVVISCQVVEHVQPKS